MEVLSLGGLMFSLCGLFSLAAGMCCSSVFLPNARHSDVFCSNRFDKQGLDSIYGLFFPQYLFWHYGFVLKFCVILSALTDFFCASHDFMQFL